MQHSLSALDTLPQQYLNVHCIILYLIFPRFLIQNMVVREYSCLDLYTDTVSDWYGCACRWTAQDIDIQARLHHFGPLPYIARSRSDLNVMYHKPTESQSSTYVCTSNVHYGLTPRTDSLFPNRIGHQKVERTSSLITKISLPALLLRPKFAQSAREYYTCCTNSSSVHIRDARLFSKIVREGKGRDALG